MPELKLSQVRSLQREQRRHETNLALLQSGRDVVCNLIASPVTSGIIAGSLVALGTGLMGWLAANMSSNLIDTIFKTGVDSKWSKIGDNLIKDGAVYPAPQVSNFTVNPGTNFTINPETGKTQTLTTPTGETITIPAPSGLTPELAARLAQLVKDLPFVPSMDPLKLFKNILDVPGIVRDTKTLTDTITNATAPGATLQAMIDVVKTHPKTNKVQKFAARALDWMIHPFGRGKV